MEFKGTKGKWMVDHEESGYNEFHQLCTPVSRKDKSYATIVGLCDVYGDDEESKYNALLISKAPEMLDMLIKAKNTLKDIYECDVTEIEQLIKSATEL